MNVYYLNQDDNILGRFKAGGEIAAAELFAAAHVLGCFYITTASTSTLIATKIFGENKTG